MITKNDIDNYFNNNEKIIRQIISLSKSHFDKDVIFSNTYINSLKAIDKMGDIDHLLVFIKRYIYMLKYWPKSRPLELSEETILEAFKSSTIVNSVASLDDRSFINNNIDENEDEDIDERLIEENNIYNIEISIHNLTNDFIKTLSDYDKILFNNWQENDITSRKGLLTFYNQNYKYGKILQDELNTILNKYKKYIINNYV